MSLHGDLIDSVKAMTQKPSRELAELISRLEKERAWLLEQIDKGNWPEFRLNLAALERELGQLLVRVADEIEEIN